MAQRRMFSLQVVDTDLFMDMPLSAQALYFHLGMRADDDGFVGNAKRIQKLVGAADDDMKILILKGFVIAFDSGVMVIRHWKISNYIQNDRYQTSIYEAEKRMLFLKPDKTYTNLPEDGAVPCIQAVSSPDTKNAENPLLPSGYMMDTSCIHRLGKDRLGKESIGEVNIYNSSGGDDARARVREEVRTFLRERCGDPSIYFGVTEDALQTAELFTIALFKQFTTRRPTSSDIANVFFNIWHTEETQNIAERKVTFPQDRKDLLMYAFEQASNAGNPGDWNYINGILKNLRVRGITTLAQAEDYDFERE